MPWMYGMKGHTDFPNLDIQHSQAIRIQVRFHYKAVLEHKRSIMLEALLATTRQATTSPNFLEGWGKEKVSNKIAEVEKFAKESCAGASIPSRLKHREEPAHQTYKLLHRCHGSLENTTWKMVGFADGS